MVYSQTLEETVFFCADEATKAALIEAGAEEWSIYTKDELRVSWRRTALRRSLPMNYGKSMRSNGRSTDESPNEANYHFFLERNPTTTHRHTPPLQRHGAR